MPELTPTDTDALIGTLESIADSLEKLAALAEKLEPIVTLLSAEFINRAKGST